MHIMNYVQSDGRFDRDEHCKLQSTLPSFIGVGALESGSSPRLSSPLDTTLLSPSLISVDPILKRVPGDSFVSFGQGTSSRFTNGANDVVRRRVASEEL